MAHKKRQLPESSTSTAKKKKAKEERDLKVNDTTIESLRIAADSVIAQKYDIKSPTHKVYIDKDGLVYDATLNMSDAKSNNNKFYIIQLLTNSEGTHFETFVRWGRVGECGTTARLEANASVQKPGSTYDGSFESAISAFKKQFKNKCGLDWDKQLDPPRAGKYVFLPRDYETQNKQSAKENADETGILTRPPPSKLAPQVQQLVELIFDKKHMSDVMFRMKYDSNSRPLGQLSEWTLSCGYSALKGISEILSKGPPSLEELEQIETFSNAYYSYIPHVIRRGMRPQPISTMVHVEQEAWLLESLGYMIEANSIANASEEQSINPLDAKYNGLGLSEMTPLDSTSKEFKELEAYLHGTVGITHNQSYKVQEIFRIEKKQEGARLEASKFAKAGSRTRNRKLLWHGSRLTNFAGILSQGLRIAPPEAPVNGYAFGKGIYLADMSSKSAQYCDSVMTGKVGLMLLCEAELGKQYKIPLGDSQAANKAANTGCWSTLGEGRMYPQTWKDASCIHPSLKSVQIPDVNAKLANRDGSRIQYNEYICYDVAQVQLRYMFRLEMQY